MHYAIGDIHGEYIKLRNLIELIVKTDPSPSFIFLGDYLDKGEHPKEVLLYLVKLIQIYPTQILMGNHEYHWLNLHSNPNSLQFVKKYGGEATRKSFDGSNEKETLSILLQDHKSFMDSLIPFSIYDRYIFTHSGIPPALYNLPPNEIGLEDFLFNRYSFLSTKQLYLNRYVVVFGHTGFYSPYVDSFKIGIDTAAVYSTSQPLTAFCVEQQRFIQSNNTFFDLQQANTSQFCPMIFR